MRKLSNAHETTFEICHFYHCDETICRRKMYFMLLKRYIHLLSNGMHHDFLQ